jgi:hypothetical protein
MGQFFTKSQLKPELMYETSVDTVTSNIGVGTDTTTIVIRILRDSSIKSILVE